MLMVAVGSSFVNITDTMKALRAVFVSGERNRSLTPYGTANPFHFWEMALHVQPSISFGKKNFVTAGEISL